VSQWVRPLDQSAKGAAEWHVSRIKSYATTTYCGKIIPGTLEVTSDDNAARGRRCQLCLGASADPTTQRRASPRKKTAAAKSTARKITKKSRRAR
jgi:hypothetical protein